MLKNSLNERVSQSEEKTNYSWQQLIESILGHAEGTFGLGCTYLDAM